MRIFLLGTIGAVALLMAGCAGEGREGRFIGFGKCAPDGSPVWYQYKNAQGNYEGAQASAENCKKG